MGQSDCLCNKFFGDIFVYNYFGFGIVVFIGVEIDVEGYGIDCVFQICIWEDDLWVFVFEFEGNFF